MLSSLKSLKSWWIANFEDMTSKGLRLVLAVRFLLVTNFKTIYYDNEKHKSTNWQYLRNAR